MTVKETTSCIKQIVAYTPMMSGYPGGAADVYLEAELKMVFYQVMRPNWKTKFNASGNDITEATFTWEIWCVG